MTTANGSPFWLYQSGAWIRLEAVVPGVSVTANRPVSLFPTLGNTFYAQIAARENRVWALSFTYDTPEATRWLDRASRGVDTWLYDQTAGQANMLDDRTTEGANATTVLVDGVAFKTFNASDTFTRKIRAGVAYQLSFTTSHTAGATIGTYNIGAGAVNIVAPSGTGARRGSVSFVPGSNVDVVVIWTVAAKTSAARFTESSVYGTVGWLEGQGGPCRVLVQKGGRTALQAFSDQPALLDMAYTLQEVG